MIGTKSGSGLGAGKAGDAKLSPQDFTFIAELVRKEIAVELTGKEYLVESRLAPVARAFSLNGIDEVVGAIKRGDSQLKADVVEAMTTNETSFFRDKHPFEALRDHIIPDTLKRNGPTGGLTIWNAASSSGQEPLSLTIMLREHFPELANSGRVKIVASDVSPAMVQRTKEGTYSRFEVNRGLTAQQSIEHFQQNGRHWVAKPELLRMIDARVLNLIEPWPPLPKCDVVMLRNVLIYFSADVKRSILTRIRRDVLKPDGCLMLGASESTLGVDDGYKPSHAGPTTIFVPGP